MRVVGIDVGSTNLALCCIEATTILHWAVITCATSTAPDVLAAWREHDIDSWMTPETIVVIERQPSKNPTMTRIQHYLEMACAVCGVRCVLQDAKLKLFYAATTSWWPTDLALQGEWTYARRKKLAVHTVSAFVTDTDQTDACRALYTSSKKKDDLADSVLHALAWAHAGHRVDSTPKKPKKVVARAPTPKQRASGKLSPSNVVWLLRGAVSPDDVAHVIKTADLGKALGRAVKKHFGSAQGFLDR